MHHKDDWEEAKSMTTAWWRHELETPLVQVVSPRAGRESTCIFDWWALVRPGVQPEQALEEYLQFCESTWFGGAAYPNMFFNMGPGVLAAFCSGYMSFEPVSCTTWFENPQPWDVVEQYRFQENEYWQFLVNTMNLFVEESKGRFIMGVTDLGGILDVLSSFRGAQELAMDLVLEPERVRQARKRIVADWHCAFDKLYPIITRHQQGMGTWMGIWAPGTWFPLQCDFCAMISPQQFEEFVLPDVAEQCRRLDYSIYHLDGPGQIPHLDMLLDIEELDGIQWVPGTGNPQCEAMLWRPLYEKILAKEKNLVLMCFDDVNKLAPVLKGLPRRGVFISAYAATEDEGRSLLKRLQDI